MKQITITMLIFRVLILALGMLFFEQRRSSSFEDAEERQRKESGVSSDIQIKKKLARFILFWPTNNKTQLTALFCHPFGYLDEDPGVADNHDD